MFGVSIVGSTGRASLDRVANQPPGLNYAGRNVKALLAFSTPLTTIAISCFPG